MSNLVKSTVKATIKPARPPTKTTQESKIPKRKRFLVFAPFTLTTTSAAVDQLIGQYKVQHSKLRLQAIIIEVYLSTLSTTAALLGTVHIEVGDKENDWIGPFEASNTTSGALFGIVIPLPEAVEVYNPQPIQIKCTPTTTTSTVWVVSLIGYEV